MKFANGYYFNIWFGYFPGKILAGFGVMKIVPPKISWDCQQTHERMLNITNH